LAGLFHDSSLQFELGKASSSEDRLERQLDILQAQQLEIMDALTAMEYEVQRLRRFRVQIRFNLLFSSLVLNTFLSD
jgi:hypothetical protein